MPLTIVHLINKSAPPAINSGGANRSVDWLARAQSAIGQRVFVASPEGHDTDYFTHLQTHEDISVQDFAASLPSATDIIHLHGGYGHIQDNSDALGVPFIQTIRTEVQQDDRGQNIASLRNAVFLSSAHMQRFGGAKYVYNGIPLDDYQYSETKENYLLFLAKVKRSKKGVDTATRIAREMRHPLIVAGGRRLATPSTWLPLSRYVRSVGVVSGQQKIDLLARARALLVPIRWDEPFGLTVAEALASGTPVIAANRGAMPELIDNGKTGFVCATISEFRAAIEHLPELAPSDCLAAARERFSIERVCENYDRLYKEVLNGAEWLT